MKGNNSHIVRGFIFDRLFYSIILSLIHLNTDMILIIYSDGMARKNMDINHLQTNKKFGITYWTIMTLIVKSCLRI